MTQEHETEESKERFIKRFNEAIRDTADYVLKLENHRHTIEFESHADGREWDETPLTWAIDEATQKLAIVMATLVQWVQDEVDKEEDE